MVIVCTTSVTMPAVAGLSQFWYCKEFWERKLLSSLSIDVDAEIEKST